MKSLVAVTRARAAGLAFASLFALALAPLACKPRTAHKPPPPRLVTLLRAEPLRAAPGEGATDLVDLAKDEVLQVAKLGPEWSKVRTLAGREGWVRRESFARRTLVMGSLTGLDVRTVADHLRTIPELDVVRVDSSGFSPANTIQAADQASRGFQVHWVIIVSPSTTGSGQVLYEVIDVEKGILDGSGQTDRTIFPQQVLDQVKDGIYSIVHHEPKGGWTPLPAASPGGSPGPAASPGASGTPTPAASPVPELPHPNAPLPPASPAPGGSPSPTPGPSRP